MGLEAACGSIDHDSNCVSAQTWKASKSSHLCNVAFCNSLSPIPPDRPRVPGLKCVARIACPSALH